MSNKPKHRTTDPERSQGVIRFEIPDEALGPDHPARALWRVLGSLDLSGFLGDARSVEGRAGRPTHSPRMMLTLWTYAISQGVGSAREIARLIESDRAYESGSLEGLRSATTSCRSSASGTRRRSMP